MKTALSFEKLELGTIEKCYAALGVMLEGEPCLIFGGEGEGSLRVFRGRDFRTEILIWEGGGGTMSIAPLQEGCFLASRGFYSMVDSQKSTVEHVRWTGEGFSHAGIATLDYLHRFDTLLAPDGARYLFAATLHSGKKDKEDWSRPGHMYAGRMHPDLSAPHPVELARLPGEFYVNHGFCKGVWEEREAVFTASREGVFVWLPPEKADQAWRTERLLSFPVSDIALADLDGDGVQEIAALLPFHGNQFHIYRKGVHNWQETYCYPVENDFYHAVISGTVLGEKVFVGGARKGMADLFLVRWDPKDSRYVPQRMEAGVGPSNLFLLNTKDGDLLLSANRMIFQAAVYRFCQT